MEMKHCLNVIHKQEDIFMLMLINKYFGCNPGENIFYIYLMKYRRWSNGRTFSRFPHFPQ